MKRLTLLLLILLQALTPVVAAGSVSNSADAVPLASKADAVQVIRNSAPPDTTICQIYRDHLGSVLLYTDGTHRYGFRYSPWGTRLTGSGLATYRPGETLAGGCPFYRTYTGHEDLWMLGLLNMNARLYSPYLGRFLCPDPLLNQEGGPLGYNPYVYANNNPYRYIDRDGELAWFIPLIGAFIGGTINVATNWKNINNFGDGALYFFGGALSGTVAAILPTTGIFGSGFISGFVTSGASSIFSQSLISGINAAIKGDNILSSVKNGINWYSVLVDAAIGGISGGIQAKQNNANFLTGRSRNTCGVNTIDYASDPLCKEMKELDIPEKDIPIIRETIEQIKANPAYYETGTSSVYVGYDVNVEYVGSTKRIPETRFKEHWRSKTPKAGLKYRAIPGTGNMSIEGSHIFEQMLKNNFEQIRSSIPLQNKINVISPSKWNSIGIPF